MTDEDYIEWNFVTETLKRFGYELREAFVSNVTSKDLVRSGRLRSEIGFSVGRQGEKGGILKFHFPSYGRMIEIHYFKLKKNRGMLYMKGANQETIRNRSRKKDTRWYTRTYYGLLNGLIGELMYGFTEAARLDLIHRLVTPYKK